MTRPPVFFLFAALLAAFALLAPPVVLAQGFSARVIVNDRVITDYEVDQRVRFLTLLNAPGASDEAAVESLIEDRLRLSAAEQAGLEATPEQVLAGMEEFAGRANLTGEQFVEALGQGGVSAQTFRDFVEAGLLWRELVRTKFSEEVDISNVEIDRAIATSSGTTSVRVLLSELVLPVEGDDTSEALALAGTLRGSIRGEAAFAEAARRYSASPSAGAGGQLDWLPLANLPPEVAPFVLGLAPGQVSDPVTVPGAVVLFLLRGIEDDPNAAPAPQAVEYAEYLLPNDTAFPAAAASVRAAVDDCDDLYAVARGLPADRLRRQTLPLGEIPGDVGLELARLDTGEASTALVRGGFRVFLMLCGRAPLQEVPVERENVGDQLINQQLSLLSEVYLKDLRANAIIREP